MIERKWIAVGVIAVLLIAGAALLFLRPASTPEEEFIKELEKYRINGEEITGKVILPSEARGVLKIEYRVNEERFRWGTLAIKVKATNIGDEEIRRGEFVFYLTDKAGNLHPETEERTVHIICSEELFRMQMAGIDPGIEPLEFYITHNPIGPGETIDLILFSPGGGMGYSVSTKIDDFWEPVGGFVITVRNLEFEGEPAVTEEPTVKTELSPSETVKALWEAMRQKNADEMKMYLSPEAIADIQEKGGFEKMFAEMPPLGEATIVTEWSVSPTEVLVTFEAEIAGDILTNQWYLKTIDGAWKILPP